VLLLSDTTVQEIARRCAQAGHDTATARIRSVGAGHTRTVGVELGAQPDPHDVTVSRAGVTVFVAAHLAALVDDATLDVDLDEGEERAQPAFVLLPHAGPEPDDTASGSGSG